MQREPSLSRLAIGPVRRVSIGHASRAALLVGAPALLIGVLAWPLLFTDATLNGDWTHHLWLIWHQSQSIRFDHHPSLFLDYSHAVLYPQYAFYGGTIYAIAGTLSLLLGEAPIAAYVSTYLMGFAAAYGGWYWLGRMAGLGRWRAQAPGLVFITSSYYITLIYARGDWPEFIAVSVIPLLIASGLSVLRAEQLRPWPSLALAASAVVFGGAHSLTIVWGSTVMVLTGLMVLACIPQTRGWLKPRAVLRVAALVVPALLVSAWFLLPTIAYETHTAISHRYPFWRLLLRDDMFMVAAPKLFTLSRASFILPGGDFALSLPVLVIGWVLVSLPMSLRKGLRGPWARMLVICAGVTVLMTIVMTHAGIILALPRPYAILQFVYRLESYVLLGLSATVLAVLVLAQSDNGRTRIWTYMLAPILLVGVVGAIQQTDAYPHQSGSRQTYTRPSATPTPREEGWTDYQDSNLGFLPYRGARPQEIDFPVASVHDGRASKVIHVQPGHVVYSNIGGGPELVHVTGARIIGISLEGNDVLEIEPSSGGSAKTAANGRGSPPTEVLSISPANGLPVVLGRLLSIGAVIFLICELIVLAIRGAPLRRARHAE
ncbi:MAG TPA: hypothetical protein VGL37_04330 [Solirubrobacteraceae bacterium]